MRNLTCDPSAGSQQRPDVGDPVRCMRCKHWGWRTVYDTCHPRYQGCTLKENLSRGEEMC